MFQVEPIEPIYGDIVTNADTDASNLWVNYPCVNYPYGVTWVTGGTTDNSGLKAKQIADELLEQGLIKKDLKTYRDVLDIIIQTL
jgi:hypothetical protein